jgi:hypothetical protein
MIRLNSQKKILLQHTHQFVIQFLSIQSLCGFMGTLERNYSVLSINQHFLKSFPAKKSPLVQNIRKKLHIRKKSVRAKKFGAT